MSNITIINSTDEVINIAVFMESGAAVRTLRPVAWKIVSPPPGGGQSEVPVPSKFQVSATYAFDPDVREDPNAGFRTNILAFDGQLRAF